MANLPPVDFTGKSAADVEASIITGYEAASGNKLYPGDPVRLFLLSVAAIIVQQRVLIDFSAKQNLLSYSEGDYLDQLGFFYGDDGERLDPQSALTTLLYTLSAPQASVFTVPAGEQATDGRVIFATSEILNIPIGQTTGTVTAKALTPGIIGNGLVAGQINVQVQPRPLVQSVANTTTSSGGAEKESDEAYRERLRLLPGRFSVAGPTDAYRFWARTANQSITDVSVVGPPDIAPGNVEVYPLMSGGVLPTSDILEAVDAVLSKDNIRPLTDNLSVLAPTAVSYSINVQYWISEENAAQAISIQAAVAKAVEDYRIWQRSKIGRDIVPDELNRLMVTAGAKRVNIISPVFTPVGKSGVAQESAPPTIAYQGVESA